MLEEPFSSYLIAEVFFYSFLANKLTVSFPTISFSRLSSLDSHFEMYCPRLCVYCLVIGYSAEVFGAVVFYIRRGGERLVDVDFFRPLGGLMESLLGVGSKRE